jgi:hypothetical protein
MESSKGRHAVLTQALIEVESDILLVDVFVEHNHKVKHSFPGRNPFGTLILKINVSCG